jgi:hypothetical protein
MFADMKKVLCEKFSNLSKMNLKRQAGERGQMSWKSFLKSMMDKKIKINGITDCIWNTFTMIHDDTLF